MSSCVFDGCYVVNQFENTLYYSSEQSYLEATMWTHAAEERNPNPVHLKATALLL